METIELYIDNNGEWIERIALVEEPAIESDFLCFGKEKLYFADEDKHLITGAVMIPNLKMWRNTNGGCYVWFSKDTVKECAYRFLKEGKNRMFNLGHKDATDKICIVESWVKSGTADKSVELGIQAPVGTWFITCKVENEKIWQEIKAGEFKGFSIEGSFLFDDRTEEEKVIEEAEAFLKTNTL